MTGVKISTLPAASVANDTDQLEVSQSGTSRRLTVGQIATLAADRDALSLLAITSVLEFIPGELWAPIAAGTSTVNLATYLQAAINAGSAELYFPAGRYRINSSLRHNGNQHWRGAGIGRTVIERSGYFGVVQALGSINTTQGNTLASNAGAGALSVTLAAGKGANFAAGDIVQLVDELVIPSGSGECKQGEFATVLSVVTDTVSFNSPIQYSYTTASTAQLLKISWRRGVQLSDMSFTNVVTTEGNSAIVYCGLCLEPKIINCSADNGINAGFAFVGCYNARAVVEVHDLLSNSASGYFGYGLLEGGGNLGGQFNITAARVRHAYTTGPTVPTSAPHVDVPHGVPTSTVITGTAIDCYASSWDTHPDGYGIIFNGCVANGSGQAGIQVRSKFNQVIGCNFFKTLGPGIYVTTTAQDTIIDGCTMDRTNCGFDSEAATDWTVFGGLEDRGLRTFATGCAVRNTGGPGISVHSSAQHPIYNSIRILDPCRIAVTFKEAISAVATTATTLRMDNIDIRCSDTRMNYGIRTVNQAQDAMITGVRVSGAQLVPLELHPTSKSWGNAVNGPVGFGSQTQVFIAGGVLDITNVQTGVIAIAGEGSVADNLDTITSGQDNQTIMIRPAGLGSITLKSGTGNIFTATGADMTLGSTTKLWMLTRVGGSNWLMTTAT